MVAQTIIRLLYLGRQRTVVPEIETVWQNACGGEPALASFSLQTLWATSQRRAMDVLRAHTVHAILLLVDNRNQHRTRFCQDLRRRYPELSIVAICREPLRPKRFGFDAELQTPLRPMEIEALLRSVCQGGADMQLCIGPIHLNLATRTVLGPRGRHQLPPKQCGLLRLLMNHAGEVVSRETIMRIVWETEYLVDTRTLDVHMRWLREKIEPEPSHPVHLITVRGQGYRLDAS